MGKLINSEVHCEECNWVGLLSSRLKADDPFLSNNTIYGCPDCKAIDRFVYVCATDGCRNRASCGVSMKKGYGYFCYECTSGKEKVEEV